MEWLKDCRSIKVTPPKRPKKLTGTRFAAVMGLSPWATPFSVWCEVTRTYEKPYEETRYTRAGKIIEPLQAAYLRRAYLMDNLVTPEDVYGGDPFKTQRGDFFHDIAIFGGMWDSLLLNPDKTVDTVVEYKTSKRVEDWAEDVPEYYALQAAEYAYLKGVDKVLMVASFLEESDYDHPELFVPTPKNTITRSFRVSERYPNMVEMMKWCQRWWNDHVLTGISPAYDEKRDGEILKALRTNCADVSAGIEELLAEAEQLHGELTEAKALLEEKEKRYKLVSGALKQHLTDQFRDGDQTVVLKGRSFAFTVSKSSGSTIDKDALEADGLLERYSKPVSTYRLNVSPIN